jgi:hypothetical protein
VNLPRHFVGLNMLRFSTELRWLTIRIFPTTYHTIYFVVVIFCLYIFWHKNSQENSYFCRHHIYYFKKSIAQISYSKGLIIWTLLRQFDCNSLLYLKVLTKFQSIFFKKKINLVTRRDSLNS